MRYYNLIGGEQVGASDWFERRNPANTNEVIAEFPKSNQALTSQAIKSAADAFPSWGSTPAPTAGILFFRGRRSLNNGSTTLPKP